MDVFESLHYLEKKIRETFAYFKSRTKQQYEGDRFEEWVIMHSNIKKSPDIHNDNAYWRLREWRSDKYVNGWYALSNLAPDLILECTKEKMLVSRKESLLWNANTKTRPPTFT